MLQMSNLRELKKLCMSLTYLVLKHDQLPQKEQNSGHLQMLPSYLTQRMDSPIDYLSDTMPQ